MSGTAGRERTAVILNNLPLWVAALRELAASSGIRVVGSSSEGGRALSLVAQLRPALFIADVDGEDGILNLDIVREVRRFDAALKVVVISRAPEPEAIGAAFAAGADVYALKSVDPKDLAAGLRQVFNQSIFVAPDRSPSQTPEPSPEELPALTRRELEILQLAGEGHTNGAMASMLWVTEQTIKFHLSNIYRKLKVSNRTEASRWAQLHGLLQASGPVAGRSEPVVDRAVGGAV
jgi:DNA-binding NarL/FixJ family response regulator